MRGKDKVYAPFRVRVIQRSFQEYENAAKAVLRTEGGTAGPERDCLQQGITNFSSFSQYFLSDKRQRKEFAVPRVLLDKSALLKKIAKVQLER